MVSLARQKFKFFFKKHAAWLRERYYGDGLCGRLSEKGDGGMKLKPVNREEAFKWHTQRYQTVLPNTKHQTPNCRNNGSTQRRCIFFFLLFSHSLHKYTFLSSLLLSFSFLMLFLPLSMAYFSFLRFSGFRLYGPRPSSSFTSHRADETTKPTTSTPAAPSRPHLNSKTRSHPTTKAL